MMVEYTSLVSQGSEVCSKNRSLVYIMELRVEMQLHAQKCRQLK